MGGWGGALGIQAGGCTGQGGAGRRRSAAPVLRAFLPHGMCCHVSRPWRLLLQAERAAAVAAAAGEAEAPQRTPPPVVGSHRTRVLLGVPSLTRSAALAAAQHVGSPTAGVRDGGTPMLPPGKPRGRQGGSLFLLVSLPVHAGCVLHDVLHPPATP